MRETARDRLPRLGQAVGHGVPIVALLVCLATMPDLAVPLTILLIQAGFVVVSLCRGALILTGQKQDGVVEATDSLPRYTVLAALRGEAAVVAQLIERLSRIDYPVDQLEGFLLLEQDDPGTIVAAHACDLPAWLQVVVVPRGQPRTKPRALNHGLRLATGSLLTVYDAEDEPHPLQLREAAARFAADTEAALGCLQAPLQIRPRPESKSTFLDRQFAAEYAGLFHVTLPGLAALGLPFPLGGTSNHFRVEALRNVGGWDAWNVTEDADLGFRLWRQGWRQGVIHQPTLESPPGTLEHWLPQRTRWLKGYMQTWGVHTRDLHGLGWAGAFALVLTIGVPLVSAALHAASLAWVVTTLLAGVGSVNGSGLPAVALAVLGFGTASAWLVCRVGTGRAGVPYSTWDMVRAPIYWSLQSLAFGHAVWRLVAAPYAWDKTSHVPDEVETPVAIAQPLTDFAPIAGRQVA